MKFKNTFHLVSLIICTILFFAGLIIYLTVNTGMAGLAVVGLSIYAFLLIAISMVLQSLFRLEALLEKLTDSLLAGKKGDNTGD